MKHFYNIKGIAMGKCYKYQFNFMKTKLIKLNK